jgi:hypothetical protein
VPDGDVPDGDVPDADPPAAGDGAAARGDGPAAAWRHQSAASCCRSGPDSRGASRASRSNVAASARRSRPRSAKSPGVTGPVAGLLSVFLQMPIFHRTGIITPQAALAFF